MDPWLEGHMRLAQAKGSLTGRTSRVGDLILRWLYLMDRREKAHDTLNAIKIRALDRSIDQGRLRELFPDFFAGADPFEGAIDEEGNLDPDLVDEDAIVFSIPKSLAEDEEISAWIREREQGAITGATIGEWV